MLHRQLLLAACILPLCSAIALAGDPGWLGLDELGYHPYRHLPPYGHASQIPGSPKWFVPGYGYRIPGFGFRAGYAETLSPYAAYYRFGRRDHARFVDVQYRFWSNSYAGPWFHAGWPGNTQTVWPGW